MVSEVDANASGLFIRGEEIEASGVLGGVVAIKALLKSSVIGYLQVWVQESRIPGSEVKEISQDFFVRKMVNEVSEREGGEEEGDGGFLGEEPVSICGEDEFRCSLYAREEVQSGAYRYLSLEVQLRNIEGEFPSVAKSHVHCFAFGNEVSSGICPALRPVDLEGGGVGLIPLVLMIEGYVGLKALRRWGKGLSAREIESGGCSAGWIKGQLPLGAVGDVIDSCEVVELPCFVLKIEFSEWQFLAMVDGGCDVIAIIGVSREVAVQGGSALIGG